MKIVDTPENRNDCLSAASLHEGPEETLALTGAKDCNRLEDERYLWLETMVNHIPDYLYAKDREGRFLYANQAIVVTNGLKSVDEMIGLTDADLHGAAAAEVRIDEIEKRVMATGEPDLGFEERAMRGGPDRWLMMSRVPLRNAAGEIVGVVGTSRDISTRKAAERMMQTQSRVLEMIVGGIEIPSLLTEFCSLLEGLGEGIRCAAVVRPAPSGPFQLFAPSLPDWPQDVQPVFASTTPAAIETAMERLAKTQAAIRCLSIPSTLGERHGLVVVMLPTDNLTTALSDFLEAAVQLAGLAIDRRLAEQKIHFLAEHDMLTGLPNRGFIDGRLATMLEEAGRAGRKIALGFLDLDNFKQINDTLGHMVGDALLARTAKRLLAFMNAEDVAARIGGDEFVLVLHETEEPFVDRIEHIRKGVAEPFLHENETIEITCSAGIACFPLHGRTATDLFSAADLAMYRAKENGRNGVQIFSPRIAEEARHKFLRAEALRQALRADEFILHYQPQVDLLTAGLDGVEALVRWQHPQNGLLPPGEFIALAEKTGLIVELGEQILKKACRQMKQWQVAGCDPGIIAVNISPRQFQNADLLEQVDAALRESGLSPESLEIEITESLILRDVDASVRIMKRLKDMGVSLALDDFGTGYSSLGMLKTLPLSRLKIDRSFLHSIPDDARDGAIVSTIISLARSLDLHVVAEGVERGEQAAFLRDAGCRYAQGFFFSRPVPAQDAARLFGTRHAFGARGENY